MLPCCLLNALKHCFLCAGVSGKLEDIRLGKETINVAQILQITYRQVHTLGSSRYTFCTTHESFAPANIVLRPNVILFSIEDEQVKFLEFDPSIEPLNTRKNPILAFTQITAPRRMIIIPRFVLPQLVEQLGNVDNKEVVWMFHTSRCGSTIWAQIFNALPNWTVISEDLTMSQSMTYSRHITNLSEFAKSKEFEEMVTAYIKLYLNIVPKGNSLLWRALGVSGGTEFMVPIIRKRFPKHKLLFSYRDVLPTAKSFVRALAPLPRIAQYTRTIDIESERPNEATKYARLIYTSGFDIGVCRQVLRKVQLQPNVFEWYVFSWATKIKTFQEYLAAGIPIKCLHYNNLIENPQRVVKEVFLHLGIPEDLVETGVKSMEYDSQSGLIIDQKQLKKVDGWKRDEAQVKRCNRVLELFGLPNIDSEFSMHNIK